MAGLILLIYIVLVVWTLANALSGRFENGDKTAWVITIIFVPFLGTILYFLIGRHQKI